MKKHKIVFNFNKVIPKQYGDYSKFNNYVFEKKIFRTGFFVIILLMVLFVAYNKFDLDYFECITPEQETLLCKNPFYQNVTWKNQEYLPIGIYGLEPLDFYIYVLISILVSIFSSFIINHLKNNIRR